MKKYNVVICRYDENLDWIKNFDENKYNIIIYNKGKDDIPFSFIKSANIGKEPETFIRYIIDNYNNLPDFTIFLQGDPIPHCEMFIDMIKDHTNEDFVSLTNHHIDFGSISNWHYPNSPKTKMEDFIKEILLKDEIPETLCAGQGAQMIIGKNVIHNRSLEYWKYLFEKILIDPSVFCYLERIWPHIFKVKPNSKYLNYRMDVGY